MSTPAIIIVTIVVVMIVYGICRARGLGPIRSSVIREGEPDVLCIADNTPEMAEAIRQARGSAMSLADRIPALLEAGGVVSIKIPFDVDYGTEHIWASARSFADGKFQCVLDNAPVDDDAWSIGDGISITPDEISDWMVYQDGRIYGAFTLHVLRSLTTGRERVALDEQLGDALPEQPTLLLQPGT